MICYRGSFHLVLLEKIVQGSYYSLNGRVKPSLLLPGGLPECFVERADAGEVEVDHFGMLAQPKALAPDSLVAPA